MTKRELFDKFLPNAKISQIHGKIQRIDIRIDIKKDFNVIKKALNR